MTCVEVHRLTLSARVERRHDLTSFLGSSLMSAHCLRARLSSCFASVTSCAMGEWRKRSSFGTRTTVIVKGHSLHSESGYILEGPIGDANVRPKRLVVVHGFVKRPRFWLSRLFHFIDDSMLVGYRNEPKRRQRTAPAFDSKQRPWLMMIRSGCHERIRSMAAFDFCLCRRSGRRIPKKIWPCG
jgi:hypothetical protein